MLLLLRYILRDRIRQETKIKFTAHYKMGLHVSVYVRFGIACHFIGKYIRYNTFILELVNILNIILYARQTLLLGCLK
jgi:hypothetical protein